MHMVRQGKGDRIFVGKQQEEIQCHMETSDGENIKQIYFTHNKEIFSSLSEQTRVLVYISASSKFGKCELMPLVFGP